MRKETSSLAYGSEGRFGAGCSGGVVVAALNAASAACSGSLVRRVLSKAIDLLLGNWRLGKWGSQPPQSCTMPHAISSVAVTIFPAHPRQGGVGATMPSLRPPRLFVQLNNNSRKNRQAALVHSI